MNNNIKGLILIIMGMLFIITQDVLIKYSINDVSLMQILVFRATIGCILLIFYLIFTKQPIVFSSAHYMVALFRGSSFFFGFTLFFISLSQISLAEATTLFFVSPFFITIFSYFILKIQIGINRLFAVCVGFFGVVLIIKPEFNNINVYMLFPIIASCSYSFSMILAKKTSMNDSLFQQTFHIYVGALLGGLLISIIIHFLDFNLGFFSILKNPWIFYDYQMLSLLIFISICGSLGILLLISAYRVSSSPILNSLFEYCHLILAVLFSFIVFDETLDAYSTIGLLLIVISGFYVLFREYKRDELLVAKTTLRS